MAVVVPETQHDAGLFAGRHGTRGIGFRQREWFFRQHVLAGLSRHDDLCGMQRVRRREGDGIDLRIGKNVFDVFAEQGPVLIGKIPNLVGFLGDRTLDVETSGFKCRGSVAPAPITQPHDGEIDHRMAAYSAALAVTRNSHMISLETRSSNFASPMVVIRT